MKQIVKICAHYSQDLSYQTGWQHMNLPAWTEKKTHIYEKGVKKTLSTKILGFWVSLHVNCDINRRRIGQTTKRMFLRGTRGVWCPSRTMCEQRCRTRPFFWKCEGSPCPFLLHTWNAWLRITTSRLHSRILAVTGPIIPNLALAQQWEIVRRSGLDDMAAASLPTTLILFPWTARYRLLYWALVFYSSRST